MRQKLDAWLSDGGTIRIVPIGAFGVAVLLGVIPMWLEFGTFPRWAPREKVGGPLLITWIAIFLAAETTRRYLAKRSVRQWEAQWKLAELDRADQLAGAIDRLCAPLVTGANGHLAPDHIQSVLLQGIVEVTRTIANIGGHVKVHACLFVPQIRREGKRQVRYLGVTSMNRLDERRGWAFKVDAPGPVQDTYRDGRFRAVPDTAAEKVRDMFPERSYRSIVTLPVTLSCAGGKRLAIVSMAASAPGTFSDELVRERLEAAVGPYIKLIALSLTIAGRDSARTRSPRR